MFRKICQPISTLFVNITKPNSLKTHNFKYCIIFSIFINAILTLFSLIKETKLKFYNNNNNNNNNTLN